ncbi:hypothetical protein SAMN04488168_1114 [Bacillus sp. 491mf]|nr:hypothetical protein SAMN04488168_1114 [Bacillus sp. 491mf]
MKKVDDYSQPPFFVFIVPVVERAFFVLLNKFVYDYFIKKTVRSVDCAVSVLEM